MLRRQVYKSYLSEYLISVLIDIIDSYIEIEMVCQYIDLYSIFEKNVKYTNFIINTDLSISLIYQGREKKTNIIFNNNEFMFSRYTSIDISDHSCYFDEVRNVYADENNIYKFLLKYVLIIPKNGERCKDIRFDENTIQIFPYVDKNNIYYHNGEELFAHNINTQQKRIIKTKVPFKNNVNFIIIDDAHIFCVKTHSVNIYNVMSNKIMFVLNGTKLIKNKYLRFHTVCLINKVIYAILYESPGESHKFYLCRFE